MIARLATARQVGAGLGIHTLDGMSDARNDPSRWQTLRSRR